MQKVLIVEDERSITTLLETLLRLDGYATASVAQPQEVLATISAEHPDLILMDYHLQGWEAVDLLQQLRATPGICQTKVIVLSALDRAQDCLEAGANGFLLKPFGYDDLSQAINQLLGTSE